MVPLTGASILLMIRSHGAHDAVSICRAAGWPPYDTFLYGVHSKLRELEGVGVVITNDREQYEVAPSWPDIQSALDISLSAFASFGPRSLVVEPLLGPPDRSAPSVDVFAVMPFERSLAPVWEDHIKPVAARLGLSISRADDFFSSHAVMTDVWNGIATARTVVADCTGRNPNVFYEIGLAHAVAYPSF